jgi:uncharacterized protein YprB with RNaseH-like and TPR domain
MGQNLRTRLQRIREAGKQLAAESSPAPASQRPTEPKEQNPPFTVDSLFSSFCESGFQTLKRITLMDFPFGLPAALPRTLPILIPDLFCFRGIPAPQDLLFFDLETTGLSGGAGTVAFLAAFGRFVPGEYPFKLQITQYLLLDYPGEADFLEAVLREFSPGLAAEPGGPPYPPLIVSYNGKSFDSQILKTRCLMNGMMPPVYAHVDLLHPARRLWKRQLPDCSQATIETEILGLDRTGDVPGALAPEIWFNFLKNGDAAPLLGICDHNLRDIRGLAAIFNSLSCIAAGPVAAMDTYRADCEQLALRWRDALRRNERFAAQEQEQRRGEELLDLAAERGYSRAAYVLALDLFRKDRACEGRERLYAIVSGDHPEDIRGLACRQLAIDAEWRLRDYEVALAHTQAALVLENIRESLRKELTVRRERLLLKRGE